MYDFVLWSGPAPATSQELCSGFRWTWPRGHVSPRQRLSHTRGGTAKNVDVHFIVFVSLAYFFELLDRLTHNLKRRGLYSFLPLVWRGETIRILRYRISGWNTPHDVSCWIPERRGTTHNEHRQSVTSTLYAPTRKLGSNGSRRWPLKGSLVRNVAPLLPVEVTHLLVHGILCCSESWQYATPRPWSAPLDVRVSSVL